MPSLFSASVILTIGSILLIIDTYDTIQGARNAMKASEIIGEPANALRIDSGNLAELAIMVRELDKAKEKFTGIILTSDLDVQLKAFCFVKEKNEE